MLLHNGFVSEVNKYNSVKLKMGISVQDSLFEQRSQVLGKFGLGR